MMPEPASPDTIFCTAIEITDEQERAAYIARACGDDQELRARVEKLVAAHFQAGSFLEQPPQATGAFDPSSLPPQVLTTAAEGPSTTIGPYKLVEEIGEGGMGTVYLAQQTEPVKRLVALKVIKPGMDSRQVIARFEAERQALALMDHPSIAKVLDAGTTESGRPYFVMELVKGVPITPYCDDNRLTPRQRLELFIPVCQAVQHAHQKGIIHRDLKPSNILVCLYDGKPVPKVIDFGVAKAAGQPLTDKTLVTGFGSVVGTLEYMSPEQAELNQLDIDTRSDVYSLGVVLYELLTGTTPLEKKRLKQAAMLEVLRVIREEEPPTPSTRLSTTDQLPRIAAARGLEPRQLSGLVRGELDWLVMKALDKDRGRRYETANDFALDIQRYLADEPVLAGPPSRTYRLRKFLRRNRGPVLAAALLLLALVGGIIGTTVGLVWEKQARAEAETAKQKEVVERREKEKALEGELFEKDQHIKDLQGWRKTAYYNGLALAYSAYQANNLVRAEEILDDPRKCPEDLRGFEWYYPKRLCHSELRHFRAIPVGSAHPFGYRGYSFSADGAQLAIRHQGNVILLDTSTGKKTSTIYVAHLLANDVVLSPDGKLLATCGSYQAQDIVYLWDTSTGASLARLSGPLRQVWMNAGFGNAAFSPDGRLLAGTDKRGNLLVWDLNPVRQRLSAGSAGFIGQQLGTQGGAAAGAPLGPLSLSLGGLLAASRDTLAPQPFQNILRTGELFRHSAANVGLAARLIGHSVAARSLAPAGAPLGPIVLTSLALAGARAETFPPRLEIAAHPLNAPLNMSWITKPAFSPDSKLVATASDGDATVRLWDAATGKLVRDLGRGADFTRLAFSPKGTWLAAAGAYELGPVRDVSVWIWHVKSGRTVRVLRGPHEPVGCLAFSPDEKQLATGSRNGLVTIWDIESAQEIRTYRGHEGGVLAVAFSADGRRLLTVDNEDTVRTWDATRHPEWQALPCQMAWQATFSGDGSRVAAAARHAQGGFWAAVVWDAASGQELANFGSQGESPQAVALSPDGRRVAAAVTVGTTSGMVRIWDVSLGQRLRDRSPAQTLSQLLAAETVAAGAAPAGAPLGALASRLTSLEGADWQAFVQVRTLPVQGAAAPCDAVAWSPDGKWIASGGMDRIVRLWDAETGRQLLALKGHAHTISTVTFSRDGKRLASASGRIDRAWPHLEKNNPLRLQNDRVEDAPDVKVWDLPSGKELCALRFPDFFQPNRPGALGQGHGGAGPALALSPDGETLAVTFGETGMSIKEMFMFPGRGEAQSMIHTYAANYPDVVRLYRAATGKEMGVLKGHTAPVWSVAFSPDGRRVATGGTDGTLRLWDPTSGEEIATIGRFSTGMFTSVAFSPDGRKIITTSNRGSARIWDALPPGK